MLVYPFLLLPHLNFSFSKPRFVLRNGELKTINVPTVDPHIIFSKESISELPFLEYDPGYKPSEWQKMYYHLSCLTREFVSEFPRWSAINPHVTDEALRSLNIAILQAFIRSVTESRAIPIVVYLPERKELASPNWPTHNIGKKVLNEAGIAYTDVTPCLLKLNISDAFVPSGGHYSRQGNAAVAKCLRPVVETALLTGPGKFGRGLESHMRPQPEGQP